MISDEKLEKLENPNLEVDTIFGIHPARLTGEFLADDPNFLQVVLLQNQTRYARMKYSFPMFGMPGSSWLAKWKDLIFAWVGFERGNPERAIICGFSFYDDKQGGVEDWPDGFTMLGEKFIIRINDKQEYATIRQLDGKQQELTVLKDKIVAKTEDLRIGDENADDPLALANEVSNLVNSILDTIIGATFVSSQPVSFNPTVITQLQQIKTQVDTIKSKTGKISS